MCFSSLFARDESFAFLNAGTLSRTPLTVLDWMEARRREDERNPTRTVFASAGDFWEAQKAVAAFLGGDAERLFLRTNVTAALNDFLFALPLKGEGEILVTGLEYGATANLARLRAAQAGLEFRSLDLPFGAEVSDEQILAALRAGLRSSTKVLVVSHVATGDGRILPVGEISRLAREREIIVVVDGAHAIGALPVDLAALPDVDFYGGNFHKWFMGPKGTAFGYTHPRWQKGLDWRFGGWASFHKPAHYVGFGGGGEAAARLFPGTMDAVPFAALGELVRFWDHHGHETIRARQAALRDLAAEIGESFGWERVSTRDPAKLGPLVSFALPAAWPRGDGIELATRLFRDHRVQVALPSAQGRALLRLSPGVYATEAEVKDGLRRLKDFA